MFDHLRAVGVLENSIRVTKTTFNVTLLDELGRVDVARGRMHERCTVRHCLEWIEHGRQGLVFDLDSVQRFERNLLGDGGHRCHTVARMKHLNRGEHGLVLNGGAERIDRDVLAGDDGHHAGHRLSLARVDIHDSCACDAGTFDLAEQHAWKGQVIDVLGLPKAVQPTIEARRALADRRG